VTENNSDNQKNCPRNVSMSLWANADISWQITVSIKSFFVMDIMFRVRERRKRGGGGGEGVSHRHVTADQVDAVTCFFQVRYLLASSTGGCWKPSSARMGTLAVASTWEKVQRELCWTTRRKQHPS
jgi:hypothetical protein